MLQCLPRIQYRVVANYSRQITSGRSTIHDVHLNVALTSVALDIPGAEQCRTGQKHTTSTAPKLQSSNELVTGANRTIGGHANLAEPQQTNINVLIDDLLRNWETNPDCTRSKPFRSAFFQLLSFSAHRWTMDQKTRLLNLITPKAHLPSPSESGRKRAKMLSITDIHWNLRNTTLGLNDGHSTEPFDKWCFEEIGRNFQPTHQLIAMWNALCLLCLPYAIRDHGRTCEDNTSSTYFTAQLADITTNTLPKRPTLMTIMSILLCQINMRDSRVLAKTIRNPSTDLQTIWEAYLSLADADASTLVQAHHAILVAVVNLCGLSRNIELLEQVLSFGGSRGLLSLIGPSGYPPAAVDVGIASILCGLNSWKVIAPNFLLSGFSAILFSDKGGMKEVASMIVIRLVRQGDTESVVVAHKLYMDTANTSFRLTSTAIEFICQALIKANLLDRAIVCCSDEALSPTHRDRMVDGILTHISADDHSSNSGLSTEMCISILCVAIDGVTTLVRDDNHSLWERLLISMQTDSPTLRCCDLVIAAPVSIWSADFLLKFLRLLVKQRLHRKAYRIGKRVSSGHPNSCRVLQQLSEILALASQPRLASATWSLLSTHEQSHASISLRLLSLVDFRYRDPRAPEVLKVPQLLLSTGRTGVRITEKELNIALCLLVRARCITAAHTLLHRLRVHGSIVHLPVTSVNVFISSFIKFQSPPCNARQLQRIFQYSQALFSRENIRPDPGTFFVLLRVVIRWKLVTATDLMDLFNACIRAGYPIGWPYNLPSKPPFKVHDRNALLIDLAAPTSLKRHIRPIYGLFVRAFKARKHKAAAAVVQGILKSLPAQ